MHNADVYFRDKNCLKRLIIKVQLIYKFSEQIRPGIKKLTQIKNV